MINQLFQQTMKSSSKNVNVSMNSIITSSFVNYTLNKKPFIIVKILEVPGDLVRSEFKDCFQELRDLDCIKIHISHLRK